MAFSEEFRDFVVEQLEPFGPIRVKRMFGGAGLYRDGTIFALLADDVLYLKADDANAPDFDAEGMAVFNPFGDPKRLLKSYRECPPRLLEDGDALCEWARKAWEAGRRAEMAKAKTAKMKTQVKSGGGR